MIRQLSRSIREYKMYAILAPLMMVGEVAMEVLIPTLMAGFMDSGVKTSDKMCIRDRSGPSRVPTTSPAVVSTRCTSPASPRSYPYRQIHRAPLPHISPREPSEL